MRFLLSSLLLVSALGLLYTQKSKVNQQPNPLPHQQKPNQKTDTTKPKPPVDNTLNKCSPCKDEASGDTAKHNDHAPNDGLFGWMNFTAVAALFTAIAAGAVSFQVWAILRSERAWLVVSVDMPPRGIQDNRGGLIVTGFGFRWMIKNYGKTPAFITKAGGRFHKIGSFAELPYDPVIDGIPDLFQPTERFPYGLSVGPGETIERYTIAPQGQKMPASQEEYQAIWDGKVIWIAYGVVEYRLVFTKKIRETRFCYTWTAGGDPESFLRSPTPKKYTKAT